MFVYSQPMISLSKAQRLQIHPGQRSLDALQIRSRRHNLTSRGNRRVLRVGKGEKRQGKTMDLTPTPRKKPDLRSEMTKQY